MESFFLRNKDILRNATKGSVDNVNRQVHFFTFMYTVLKLRL